jgi:hypothetical protein
MTNSIWIGHILRRICLIKSSTEGKVEEWIELTRRRRRRRKQLWDDLKEKEGYWHSKTTNERINTAGDEHVGTAHGHKEKDIICFSVPLRVEYQRRHAIAERLKNALLGQ